MALATSTDTLAAGASRTFGLSPGSALTLVAPPNVRATITETPNTVSASGVGGNASRTHNLQLAQTVTYGPYPMGGTVVVANASDSGTAITWVRSDSIMAESAEGAISLVDTDGGRNQINIDATITAARAARIAASARGPMIVAADLAGIAAYALNDVVKLSTGQHLTCTGAGNSSGTPPVLSATVLDGRPITDGTVTWYPAGIVKTASDANVPTVTARASAAAASLTETKFVAGGTSPTGFASRGGRFANMGPNNYVNPFTFAAGNTSYSGGGTAAANNAGFSGEAFAAQYNALELDVTDSKFGITFHTLTGLLYIEIDGQPVQAVANAASGTSGNLIEFDFNGLFKTRRLRIVLPFGAATPTVRGIALTSQGSFAAAPASTDVMLVLGDSVPTTVVPASGAWLFHWTYWLEHYLGVQDVISASLGSSGYTTKPTNGYTTGEILASANNLVLFAGYAPSHILFTSGYNDRNAALATVQAAALAAWQEARRQFPNAKITVGDGYAGATGPSAAAIALAAGLQATFTAWADPNSRFVSVMSSMAGTADAGDALGTGNASVTVSTDGTHPSPFGARYWARVWADAINVAWLGNY